MSSLPFLAQDSQFNPQLNTVSGCPSCSCRITLNILTTSFLSFLMLCSLFSCSYSSSSWQNSSSTHLLQQGHCFPLLQTLEEALGSLKSGELHPPSEVVISYVTSYVMPGVVAPSGAGNCALWCNAIVLGEYHIIIIRFLAPFHASLQTNFCFWEPYPRLYALGLPIR